MLALCRRRISEWRREHFSTVSISVHCPSTTTTEQRPRVDHRHRCTDNDDRLLQASRYERLWATTTTDWLDAGWRRRRRRLRRRWRWVDGRQSVRREIIVYTGRQSHDRGDMHDTSSQIHSRIYALEDCIQGPQKLQLLRGRGGARSLHFCKRCKGTQTTKIMFIRLKKKHL